MTSCRGSAFSFQLLLQSLYLRIALLTCTIAPSGMLVPFRLRGAVSPRLIRPSMRPEMMTFQAFGPDVEYAELSQ